MKNKWVRRTWNQFSKVFPSLALDINYLRKYHHFDKDLWVIPKYCNKQGSAIDIGANMGIFSRWMAKHAKNVYSFECNPFLFPNLKKVLPKNVILETCALSSKPGEASLRFDPGNTGIGTIEKLNKLDQNSGIRNLKSITVKVARLDDFNLDHISFIKIDVEGHELEVLKGAKNLLKRDFPTLLIEIEDRHCPGNLKAVPEFLESFGYSSYFINKMGFLNHTTDITNAAKNGQNNFWFCHPNSIHSFIS